jgi:tetratricopeptide (TPR) repeat protein
MRTLIFSLFVAVSAAHAQTAPVTPGQTADAYYAQGLAAEKAGDVAAARDAFGAALRVNPQHANARYRLGLLRTNAAAIAARGREAKLGAVMVPEIQLDGATMAETIEHLGALIERESKGETAPNFVIQDPKGLLRDHKITLQLKNVPVSAVLQYVTTQANAKIRYDEHAVVIEPR